MIRQTSSDRLRWWATLLEGRTIADRQHGWSGLWLSSEDAAALVHTLREAAGQAEIPLGAPASDERCDDDWPDTQPGGFIDIDVEAEAKTGGPAASVTRAAPPPGGHPGDRPVVHAVSASARCRPVGGLRLLNPLRLMQR